MRPADLVCVLWQFGEFGVRARQRPKQALIEKGPFGSPVVALDAARTHARAFNAGFMVRRAGIKRQSPPVDSVRRRQPLAPSADRTTICSPFGRQKQAGNHHIGRGQWRHYISLWQYTSRISSTASAVTTDDTSTLNPPVFSTGKQPSRHGLAIIRSTSATSK